MNFFEHQDQARSKATHLVLLFAAAVLSLIILTTFLVATFLGYVNYDPAQGLDLNYVLQQVNSKNFGLISLVIICVVAGGSFYKLAQLSGGGKVIAEMIGGTLVDNNSHDPNQQKLINVVEEMAIASGSPVPPIYLLPDNTINAFAAGFNLNDAVIGVTKGCIQRLDRDELQGVIAHEFSHIFHGDMRINIRLIGILHGILLIGLIGYHILEGISNRPRSSRSKNNSIIGIAALAFGLIVIGFGGVFFGSMIKSAVSRQREFLADASAVKFTRNPGGIANALKKIGGTTAGAKLRGVHIKELSHLFFGEATKSLFATHPPLKKRIYRLQPDWDGYYIDEDTGLSADTVKAEPMKAFTDLSSVAVLASNIINQVGSQQPEQLDYAQQLLQSLPEFWHKLAQTPDGARAVIYALLIQKTVNTNLRQQLTYVLGHDNNVLRLTRQLIAIELDERQRLPIVDIALAQLGKMTVQKFESFIQLTDMLIRADKKISLFEWSLYTILIHHLKPLYGKLTPPISKYRTLGRVKKQCQILFSILAFVGDDGEQRVGAFQAAVEKSDLTTITLLPVSELDITAMSQALEDLNKLYPLTKPALLKACIACICADDQVTTAEHELIRAIAAAIDCPMPPIVIPTLRENA